MDRGIPIRAISRAFSVLTAINQHGPISMARIAEIAQIPYPTASRIVLTLIHEAFVELEPARKRYRVTERVKSLSTGFRLENKLVTTARAHIETLCRNVLWPIAITTRVGTRMVVRDSTHSMTSLTFTNYYPGHSLPITECASGKVYLATCEDAERQDVIDRLSSEAPETERRAINLLRDAAYLENIRTRGYATQLSNIHSADPGKTSSIAVPIFDASHRTIGSLVLVYFALAMNETDSLTKYLDHLKNVSAAITVDLEAAPLA
jgi:IclR family transcriptional regulator, mhp operon transcriptional activator